MNGSGSLFKCLNQEQPPPAVARQGSEELYEAGRGSVGKHCRFVGNPRRLGGVYHAGFGILTFYLQRAAGAPCNGLTRFGLGLIAATTGRP